MKHLYLEARTRSVADQNHFAPLVIDDYRYDEPNYFTDKRVPNVTFEVTRLESGGFKPVPFAASVTRGHAPPNSKPALAGDRC